MGIEEKLDEQTLRRLEGIGEDDTVPAVFTTKSRCNYLELIAISHPIDDRGTHTYYGHVSKRRFYHILKDERVISARSYDDIELL